MLSSSGEIITGAALVRMRLERFARSAEPPEEHRAGHPVVHFPAVVAGGRSKWRRCCATPVYYSKLLVANICRRLLGTVQWRIDLSIDFKGCECFPFRAFSQDGQALLKIAFQNLITPDS